MTRKPRTYTYRIPLDETVAMIRLRRFQRKDEYWITEHNDRDVPNRRAMKNLGVAFFRSKETRGDYRDDFQGGAIPGLSEYRYSLDWERTPETELLEMKRHHEGGTEIRGEQFVGTHDPRLPDYMKIETKVPWTPKEIKEMFNGEDVPNRLDYHHNHPQMPASEARDRYHRLIDMAANEAFEEAEEALMEYEQACNHDHAIETKRGGFCEDCGREWHDDYDMEQDEVTIVGTA